MGKNALHSLLAVESDVKSVGAKVLNEAVNTFSKREDHFDGFIRSYKALKEEDSYMDETKKKEINTSVKDKIDYVSEAVAKAISISVSKEETNSSGTASAELKVNGESFGIFSATSLLSLEKDLVKIRDMYMKIPTLDPARPWTREEMETGMVFKSEPEYTFKTKKIEDFIVVVEPTEFHPAQTEKVVKDVNVGKYTTTYTSGKVTPLLKSQLLARIDAIISAVKVARSKANEAEVVKTDIGQKLLNYINAPLT